MIRIHAARAVAALFALGLAGASRAADAEHDEQHRPRDRERNGHENDQRIAKTLVLRSQHQIDDDQREHEHGDEGVSLLLVLA